MSGKQKLLLALLAAVLVVGFFAAAAGRDGGQGSASGDYPFINLLGRLAGDRAAIDPALVTADCESTPDGFAVAGSCVLHVARPESMSMLILRGATAFTVTAPAPGGADLEVSGTVDPSPETGAVAKVAIDEAVDVRLSCAKDPVCVVRVASS